MKRPIIQYIVPSRPVYDQKYTCLKPHSSLAQSDVWWTFNPEAVGSRPARANNFFIFHVPKCYIHT